MKAAGSDPGRFFGEIKTWLAEDGQAMAPGDLKTLLRRSGE